MKDIKEMLSPMGAEVSIIPVMQGDSMMKVNEAELPDSLPVLALRNAVLFPGTVYPITIGREKSIRLIQDSEKNNTYIGAVPQLDVTVEDPKKEDLYGYGTVAKIIKTLEMPDGTLTAILQGFKRFELETIVEYDPYMLGRVHYLNDIVPEVNDNNIKMIVESAQLLSAQDRLSGRDRGYRLTHAAHPCRRCLTNPQNYNWLCAHLEALLKEYEYRFGKRHRSGELFREFWSGYGSFDPAALTLPKCMPEVFRTGGDSIDGVVASYRNFYRFKRLVLPRFRYTGREAPEWLSTPGKTAETSDGRLGFFTVRERRRA